MGIGYVIGCLLSILLWRLDRQIVFNYINRKVNKKIKNVYMIQFLYLCGAAFIYVGLNLMANNDFIKSYQVYNAFIAFMVIDVSNTERKNLSNTKRKHFYDTISTISRALICGFITPLFYISIIGNAAAIVFMLLYNLNSSKDLNIIDTIVSIAIIIPAIIGEMFLYVIYIFRNKNLKINFKGDYISNLWRIPLLNVDILAAYIESVNFYFHYSGKDEYYLKCYGDYNNKIDDAHIKDYLSISYSICFIIFTIFVVIHI